MNDKKYIVYEIVRKSGIWDIDAIKFHMVELCRFGTEEEADSFIAKYPAQWMMWKYDEQPT
jgi:hypothetical protein